MRTTILALSLLLLNAGVQALPTTTQDAESLDKRTMTTATAPAPTYFICARSYTSVAGDTCCSIGAKFGYSSSTISAANTRINCNDIWPGTPICLPPGGAGGPAPTRTATTLSRPPGLTCIRTYSSVAGDTCDSLGVKFGYSSSTIKAANSFLNCNDIWPGTPISLPSSGSRGLDVICVRTYTSVAGDTCDSLGVKFGYSPSTISAANSFLNCNDIWPGTPICLPSGGSGGSGGSTCTHTIYSTVGDTCNSIGSQYGVSGVQIKLWNSFLTCSNIWTNTPVCVSH